MCRNTGKVMYDKAPEDIYDGCWPVQGRRLATRGVPAGGFVCRRPKGGGQPRTYDT
jgi:hypothetical protein